MQAFRKTLVPGDPDRNWTLLWDITPLPAEAFTLSGVVLAQSYPARNGTAQPWCRVVTIPDGTPAGLGVIQCGDRSLPIVIGEPRWSRKGPSTINPDAGVSVVERELQQGRDVILAPGLHTWDRALDLTAVIGATISGYGAHVRRKPDGDYGERMIKNGDNLAVEGVTFHPAWIVFHGDGHCNGLVVKNCTFNSGIFGYSYVEAAIMDCLFDGGGCNYAQAGIYLRCRYRDNPTTDHAFFLTGPCVGQLALIDLLFDGTGRGPCFSTSNGPVTDNLFVGTTCRGINRDDNGNEIFQAEGANEYSRNLRIHTRVYDCDSHVAQLWDCPARDNLGIDTVIDGGGGFWIAGVNDVDQTGNIEVDFELRNGAGVTIGWLDGNGRAHGANAVGNSFRDGAIVNWKPSKVNQPYSPTTYTRMEPMLAIHPNGEQNDVDVVVVESAHDLGSPLAKGAIRQAAVVDLFDL